MREVLDELIKIVKEDSTEALGCTEPVAVAFCANVAGAYIDKSKIENIDVKVSKNIYKNGKSVKIPNTGSYGLDLAAAVGALVEKSDEAFMVFSKVDEKILEKAKELLKENKVKVSYVEESHDIFISIKIDTKEKVVEAIVEEAHTHVSKIIVDGKVIYEDEYESEADENESDFDITDLSFKELREIIEAGSFEDFKFTLKGIDVNMKAARAGLEGEEDNLGKTLNELKEKGILSDNFVTESRILTAAAANTRMSGGDCPIMTSGGSGNQGIGVILPIAIVAEEENVSDERLAKALFFGHAINRYVKEYSGKLSGICGCAIGAAIGAAAGIAWLLGGGDKEIAGACSNIYANLTGVICDGAKESCAMKLSTTAEESIVAAYLAVNGIISQPNVGILGDSIEETISNIGKLSRGAFTNVDELMLEIIDR